MPCNKQCMWLEQHGLPLGLALLFQPVTVVERLGFQASQTIFWKFLTLIKDKILKSQKITGNPLWLPSSSGDQVKGRGTLTSFLGHARSVNVMKSDMEQVAPLWRREQHDWQEPGVACCPFVPTVVATEDKALAFLQLVVAENYLSQKLQSIHSTCIFWPVLVLAAFPPCFFLFLPCSFTPRWILKD